MTVDTDVAGRLIAVLRNAAATPGLEYERRPEPMQGGFWAELFSFSLSNPPAGWPAELVARLMPDPGSARKETIVQRAVAAAGFPTPCVRVAGGPDDGLGQAFMVMDRAAGKPALSGLDGGLTPAHGEDTTRLYFPSDQHEIAACVKRIYKDPGLRFVFSTRAAVPDILGEDNKPLYQGKAFEPGKDSIVRAAPAGGGYVIAYGETLYRALDAVIRLNEAGVKVGLINKPSLNVVDKDTMKKLAGVPFVLVAEGWNVKTGLGSRFGSYLLQAGFKGRYDHIGTNREGCGGLWQQMGNQGLDSAGIEKAIRELL